MSDAIIRQFLDDEYLKRRRARPNYSYRSFAELLGTDVSTLIQILKGKRKISFEKARELLDSLKVPLHKRNAMLLSLDDPSQYTDRGVAHHSFTAEELTKFEDWEGWAAMVCLDLENIPRTAAGIAGKIGADPEKVQKLLDYAAELGLVLKDGLSYHPAEKNCTISDPFHPSLFENHRQWIQQVIDRIQNQDTDDTFISGITVSCSRSKLPEARRRISEFRRSLGEYLDDGQKDTLVRLNFQFYPVRESRPKTKQAQVGTT